MCINFSENKNKIHGMRDKLLLDKFNNEDGIANTEMTFAGMTSRVFTIPSYSEIECCTESVNEFSIVRVRTDNLEDDLSNLQESIDGNFEEISMCTRCKQKPKIERNFGNHIFVEVSKFLNFNFVSST